jgi:hypothetical protein
MNEDLAHLILITSGIKKTGVKVYKLYDLVSMQYIIQHLVIVHTCIL